MAANGEALFLLFIIPIHCCASSYFLPCFLELRVVLSYFLSVAPVKLQWCNWVTELVGRKL